MANPIENFSTEKPAVASTFAGIGGLWAAYQLYKLASFINLHLVRRSHLDRYSSAGSGSAAAWALVTGASDGIGKGFAEELCHRGFNVILHGRNEAKLNAVREGLLKQWPKREVRILLVDAGNEAGDTAKIDAAVAELKDLNLKILVNNVGGSGGLKPGWSTLHNRSADDIRLFIDLNARFPTEITRALLPQLIERSPALILNVGSLAGELPAPYLSVYSGSKAYNKAWSRSLGLELKAEGHDVEVIDLLVGMVSSGSEPRDSTFFVPSSRRMAAAGLDKVGCGQYVVWGYWPHELQFRSFVALPTWIGERIFLGIAKDEMAKEEREMKTQ